MEDEGYDVALDDSGNIYTTGHISPPVDLDPGPGVDEYSEAGSFLSKFDPSGNYLFGRVWKAHCRGAAVDDFNNVFIVGGYSGPVDLDPGPGIDEHAGAGVFLSKFDSDGYFQWARTWDAWMDYSGNKVAVDYSGNACVTGMFENTVDFDPGPGVDEHTAYYWDAYLSKFPPDGNW